MHTADKLLVSSFFSASAFSPLGKLRSVLLILAAYIQYIRFAYLLHHSTHVVEGPRLGPPNPGLNVTFVS